MRRTADRAAFFAAPDSRPDQRRYGTQDVNDPMYGPATHHAGRRGVVHVLGSACRSRRSDERAIARRFRHAARPETPRKARAFLSVRNLIVIVSRPRACRMARDAVDVRHAHVRNSMPADAKLLSRLAFREAAT